MNKTIDALTARTQFGDVMKQAERDQTRFVVNRRGRPSVVIMSVDDYLRNVVKKSTLVAELQTDAMVGGLGRMTDEDVVEVVKEARAERRHVK